jgi:hypothetical protein
MCVRDVQLIEDRMLKRWLVVGLVVAGCQGPEAFRAHSSGIGLGAGTAGTGGPGAGTTGVAGTGVIPIMVSGAAGTGPGAAGSTGAAGTDLTGVAGTGAGTAGAGGVSGGNAGTLGAAGAAGSGAAGTAGGAGAGGQQGGGVDAGVVVRDAATEAAPASVAYASTTWKATASITAAGNADVPANAIDGKLATRWSTGRNQMGDETFTIDLGQVVPVSRVVLDDSTNTQDFRVAYTLEVSTNGTTFTAVKMGRGATMTDIQFARVNARYVRIRQTGMTPAGGSWWSIDELRIYS